MIIVIWGFAMAFFFLWGAAWGAALATREARRRFLLRVAALTEATGAVIAIVRAQVERQERELELLRGRPIELMSFVVGPITAQGGESVDALQLTNEQQCPLSIAPRTVHGHPARVDGTPIWVSSNSNVRVNVNPDDPTKAVAVAVGLGKSQISVTADADLGDGVRTITATLDVEVVAAQAESLGLTVGTPENQPEPAPTP